MVDQILKIEAEDVAQEDYDTSNPEQVNKARKKSARNKADRLRFVSAAMSYPEGRAWFYDLIIRCHIFTNPWNRDNQYATAFRCGEHNIGLQILGDIQDAAPKEYLLMIEEAKG